MGYSETMCQLCGVSFAIARYRRPDEPFEAAWSYYGSGFNDADQLIEQRRKAPDLDTPTVDCYDCIIEKRLEEVDGMELEHVAGKGCKGTSGYSGWRISLEEMKGCRAVQCLAWKGKDWKPEDDDQDFELDSQCFLTGFGDGSPDEASLDVTPPRHGLSDILISNAIHFDDMEDWGLPFHPTCFAIFGRISRCRFGMVHVDGLWNWRSKERTFEEFTYDFPRAPEVRSASEQWWWHEPGFEYLVANPIDIPGFKERLNNAAAGRKGTNTANITTQAEDLPPFEAAKGGIGHTDVFAKLPAEVSHMLLNHLSSRDIANMRLVSRSYRQLPTAIFKKLLGEEMEWFWEVEEMATDSDWYGLWKEAKNNFGGMMGLRNRRRIWTDVTEIANRIEKYDNEKS